MSHWEDALRNDYANLESKYDDALDRLRILSEEISEKDERIEKLEELIVDLWRYSEVPCSGCEHYYVIDDVMCNADPCPLYEKVLNSIDDLGLEVEK